ncbi:hypothetical protein [Novosphingobium sp.]|uniref:hypothetical protein n=1 Tax=Novosphingobium sp. TaxID=1874826 RepID=UPI0025ED5815|nr:hypothetical protein [Novosphingobium sp.]MCC6926442.1 hypothetical protein [Novosphingobium sp.]
MRIEITKGVSEDRIVLTRADGSVAETRFPKKGPVPHDAVHWFVERELRLARGFWGTVAAGIHPEEVQEIAKAAGHASARRAEVPGSEIVELLQAERIVECLEADLWSPGGAASDLLALAETACGYSHVPLPAGFDEAAVDRIRSGLGTFAKDWIAAPQGHCARLEWED